LPRTTSDDKVALQAIESGLDRIGLTKVNKSESLSKTENTNKEEVDITDQTGLLARLEKAPPTVQSQAAEKLEDLLGLITEHSA
jgi:hypothetical protein